MSNDEVIVTFRGEQFSVNRTMLAENMRKFGAEAKSQGIRPGDRVNELFVTSGELSADEIALGVTIMHSGREISE